MTKLTKGRFPDQRVGYNVVDRLTVFIAAGETYVLDVRGCIGFAAIFEAGAHTATPCSRSGTVIPGATNIELVSEELVPTAWPLYLIEADAENPLVVAGV